MQLENKVHEIAACLFEGMKQKELDKQDLGLLSGQTGIIVFCSCYLRKYPDPEKTAVLDGFLDSFFDRLCSGVEMFTYCTGLAGILHGLRYLNEEKLIEVDCSDIENNYKTLLRQFSLSNISNRNYDFLHGGIGVVKYFSHDAGFVNEALDALDRAAEKDGEKYRWVSRLGLEETFGYNISLSHGMSSIVSMLSAITTPGVDFEKRDSIITHACNYILSQEIDHERYGCYFPTMSLDNEGAQLGLTRMGWCYGDLGVATSLWQAGLRLKRPLWQEKALEVLRFNAHRRSLPEGAINDGGLCHGAAGVAMMYHYMYLQTGENLFAETRDYWLDATLKIAQAGEGAAGYRAWRGRDKPGQTEYDLLEGVAGIGLMLMTFLSADARDARWMNFLLLNDCGII